MGDASRFEFLDPVLAGPTVAGIRIVLETELARKLGKAAYHVWQILITRRDPRGVTHAKISTLATARGFTPTKPRTVKYALNRLREAGLVEDKYPRRQWLRTEAGDERWLFPRRVYGARVRFQHARQCHVLVPESTYAWMQSASSHGGARIGTGPKTDKMLRNSGHKSIQVCPYAGQFKYVPVLLDSTSSDHTCTEQVGYFVTAADAAPVQQPSALRAEQHQAHQPQAPGFQPYVSAEPKPESVPMSPKLPAHLGTSLGGAPQRPVRLPIPGMNGVPALPGPNLIAAAATPAPPHFPADLDEDGRVQWLLRYYRGAYDSRWKPTTPCGFFKNRRALKPAQLALLRNAAEALAAFNLRPAAWVAWRFDLWRTSKRSTGAPHLAYVLDPVHMDKHLEWFRSEEAGYMGGRVMYGDEHRELMERHAAMMRALTWARATTAEEVRRVVDQHLPPALYDRLVAAARARAAQDTDLMKSMAAEGQWVGW